MKPDGKFCAWAGSDRPAVRRREAVLSIENASVCTEPNGAVVDDAAVACITVVRGAQRCAARIAIDTNIVRSAHDWGAAQQPPGCNGFEKMARRLVIDRHGRMRGCRARDLAPIFLVDRR